MEQSPQKKLVTQIALEDLERRRQEIAPQVDANIEEVLRICEQRLKEAGEPPQKRKSDQDWDAEFNFWHKIISEEVERLRFNSGYEPVRIDLYPAGQGSIAFMGETQVGRTRFNAVARWERDSSGREVLRLTILKAK